MADVYVDYIQLAKNSQKWRNIGNNIFDDINSITNALEELNQTWYGNRFNILMKSYEEDVMPLFQEIVDLIYTRIPYWANSAAVNYAKVQGEEVFPILDQEEIKIKFPSINIVKGSFNIDEKRVMESISIIENKTNEILEYMDIIMKELNDENTWRSVIATKSRNTIKNYRRYIYQQLGNLVKALKLCMELTIQDVQKAEQASNFSG